jgi:parallel beta-helix repeat protein
VGVAGSLDGISVSGSRSNIVIRNGAVRGWGSDGIQAGTSYNSSFSDLRVANNVANGLQGGNGAVIKCVSARANRGIGITTSAGCAITDCASSENVLDGIVANTGSTVTGSSAYNNGRTGISAETGSTLVNCTAYSNTNGISASSGSTVNSCTATANATNGILAAFGSTIVGCTARDNLTGINVGEDCRVVNNTCDRTSAGTGTAILVRTSGNRVDGNNVNEHARGIHVLAAGNVIIRNSAFGNTTADYTFVGVNTTGEIVGPGIVLNETHGPWANISF